MHFNENSFVFFVEYAVKCSSCITGVSGDGVVPGGHATYAYYNKFSGESRENGNLILFQR